MPTTTDLLCHEETQAKPAASPNPEPEDRDADPGSDLSRTAFLRIYRKFRSVTMLGR